VDEGRHEHSADFSVQTPSNGLLSLKVELAGKGLFQALRLESPRVIGRCALPGLAGSSAVNHSAFKIEKLIASIRERHAGRTSKRISLDLARERATT
jgi:hypothetical protein